MLNSALSSELVSTIGALEHWWLSEFLSDVEIKAIFFLSEDQARNFVTDWKVFWGSSNSDMTLNT